MQHQADAQMEEYEMRMIAVSPISAIGNRSLLYHACRVLALDMPVRLSALLWRALQGRTGDLFADMVCLRHEICRAQI